MSKLNDIETIREELAETFDYVTKRHIDVVNLLSISSEEQELGAKALIGMVIASGVDKVLDNNSSGVKFENVARGFIESSKGDYAVGRYLFASEVTMFGLTVHYLITTRTNIGFCQIEGSPTYTLYFQPKLTGDGNGISFSYTPGELLWVCREYSTVDGHDMRSWGISLRRSDITSPPRFCNGPNNDLILADFALGEQKVGEAMDARGLILLRDAN